MIDRIRSTAYAALTSPRGDRLPPVRWSKALARLANDRLGRPLADREELGERRAFETRMAARDGGASAPTTEQAPVLIYTRDKDRREVDRIVQILDEAGLQYTVLDLEGDDAALAAHERDGKGFPLPCVYIAGEPVGGHRSLLNLGVAALRQRAFGG